MNYQRNLKNTLPLMLTEQPSEKYRKEEDAPPSRPACRRVGPGLTTVKGISTGSCFIQLELTTLF